MPDLATYVSPLCLYVSSLGADELSGPPVEPVTFPFLFDRGLGLQHRVVDMNAKGSSYKAAGRGLRLNHVSAGVRPQTSSWKANTVGLKLGACSRRHHTSAFLLRVCSMQP